jgi:hypothetical protein
VTTVFVHLEIDGVLWEVADSYHAPIAIGAAAELAEDLGYELPTCAMVDAIWRAADLRVEPPMRKHDGTWRTMATPAVYKDQEERIAKLLEGKRWMLLAGTHKDVVFDACRACAGRAEGFWCKVCDAKHRGKKVLGLYGWHRTNGRVIQPFFAGHSREWIDYAQGLRLVRRVVHPPVVGVAA